MARVRPAVDGPKNSVTIAVLPRSVTAVVVDVAISPPAALLPRHWQRAVDGPLENSAALGMLTR